MLDKKQILSLANLARLDLSADETKSLADDLSKVLDFVNELKELDTESVDPTHQASGQKDVWRQDLITREKKFKEKLLREAPVTNGEFIKVRAILEDKE